MRSYWTLPTTDGQKDFFSAYAKFTGKIQALAVSSQLLSALTESVIFYTLGYDTFLPFGANIAVLSGVFAALLGVCLIELFGLRVCLPQMSRQFLYKRFSGGHLAITFFVSLITVALVLVSFKLSLDGGRTTVKTQLDKLEAKQAQTIQADNANGLQLIGNEFATDSTEIETRYAALINSENQKYSSKLDEARAELRTWTAKRGNYQTRINRANTNIKRIEAERAVKIAELQSSKALEQKTLRGTKNASQDSLQAVLTLQLDSNTNNYNDTGATFQTATKYAVILAMILSIFCIIIQTVFKKHSGQVETPLANDYTFRQSAILEGFQAIQERLNVAVRNRIVAFEDRTPQAKLSNRVAPVYDRAELKELVIKLQVEQLDDNAKTIQIAAPTLPQIERQRIGFKTDKLEAVNNASVTQDATVKTAKNTATVKGCLNCGADISHRRSDAKYCSDVCKMEYHSKKHNGRKFDAGQYHSKRKNKG